MPNQTPNDMDPLDDNPNSASGSRGTSSNPNPNSAANSGGSNEFVRKLFTMLEDPSYRSVVRWSDTGDSFVVLDTNEFTKTILPRHFKHSNFASFVRQLNKYDFHKIRANETGTAYGDNAWQFKHPDFQIDKKNQIDNIRRKATTTRKVSTTTTTEPVATPVVPDYFKSLETEASSLRTEVKSLRSEVAEFKSMVSSIQSAFHSLQESHSITLHKLNALQSSSKVSNEVLRKLLVMETSSAQAQEKHVHVLDLLQKLNTSESTRNDTPIPPISYNSNTSSTYPNNYSSSYQHGTGNSHNRRISFSSRPSASPADAQRSPSITSAPSPVSRYTAGMLSVGGSGPRYTVLLVDDDDVSVRRIRRILRDYGCDVDVANDGVDAWRRAEANIYDLVLMDLVIPSLDGVAAASQMRQSRVMCPIIAMVVTPQQTLPNKVEKYRQDGITDVILKPFKKELLNSFLKKYMPPHPVSNSTSNVPMEISGTSNTMMSSHTEGNNSSSHANNAGSEQQQPLMPPLNPLNIHSGVHGNSPQLGSSYNHDVHQSQHRQEEPSNSGNSGTSLLAEAAAYRRDDNSRRHSSTVSDQGLQPPPGLLPGPHDSMRHNSNYYGSHHDNGNDNLPSQSHSSGGTGLHHTSSQLPTASSPSSLLLNGGQQGSGITLPPPPPLHSHPHAPSTHVQNHSPHLSNPYGYGSNSNHSHHSQQPNLPLPSPSQPQGPGGNDIGGMKTDDDHHSLKRPRLF